MSHEALTVPTPPSENAEGGLVVPIRSPAPSEAVHFGKLVVEARQRLGWAQWELAEFARVSQPTISRLENGTGDISFAAAAKLVRALGIDPALVFQPRARKTRSA